MALWRLLGISTSAVVVLTSLAYLLLVASLSTSPSDPTRHPLFDPSASSSEHPHRHFQAPAENPWAELDEVEASQVYLWLQKNTNIFNSTDDRAGGSRGDNNPLNLIELLRPNKSSVVDYLDHNGPIPDRWARLSAVETKGDDAFIVEYMVGPLPPSNNTQILPLTYCHNSGRNYVQSPVSDVFALLEWALSIGENASDVTQELLGAKTNRDDLDDPNGLVMGSRPALIESGRMVHWLEFFGPGIKSDGRSLLPQGLYVKLNVPNANPESWTTSEWFYNGILYDNLTMLRQAMASPRFERLTVNEDGEWTDTEGLSTSTPERDMPPPLSIQPYGPRYRLDRSEKYISWMGFSFYLSTSQATALSLFDIRYNNSRLMYQLGLQEALAHYAGVEPMQSGLEFLDTFFGMGKMMFSLVPGLDCPGHAEYLDMSYHRGGKMYTNRNAICVFEYTSDAPLQRHTSAFSATVSRNTYLVVRSVSTVGNYDYTIDYIFYLDGSIEVKLRASGYIFGAFHAEPRSSSPLRRDSSTNEYGYRVRPALHTSMHDHVVNFRADLDICGTANTVVRTSIEPLERAYDWDQPEVPGPRNTMHMVHTPVKHETGLNWPRNAGEMFLITSPNSTNKWGETRAYRILPGTGMGNPAHLTVVNSTALGKAATWSTADLWVLRNHPATEPGSAHHYNALEPLTPLVDFTRMVEDREAVEEEDLVLYFNLGGHHVPSSQDIPNTLMHTSASSVMFMPFNYFDDDVSKPLRQGVRVDRSRHGASQVKGDDAAAAKEEVRRTPTNRAARSNHAAAAAAVKPEEMDKKNPATTHDTAGVDDPHDGISWFGARYTAPVLVTEQMLSPDLSHYMKERDDGEQDGWKTVRNNVGGGLYGLFVGKQREQGSGDSREREGGARLDW
ncbi:hypothetical protein AYO21_05463 [Fonsecaea monophora]|uniref:Amine oxidase n=1 Tax=Fonsecaea monophora TaxID=254056 RepID=A0A177FAC6_9EURO|nr:hypothetical protein AYO21_05463 [Fonsecaea monophora]KAH0843678.1 putative Copper amine oxidase [Fonsecaea pedrosoi]OAG40372.1 hypothetical protein AYO21_05463 [Fonsecaea monophora]